MGEVAGIYLTGIVQHGNARGRQLGFPTANLIVSRGSTLPSKGVYVARIDLDGDSLGGVVNIGNRPTFGEGDLGVELHILDFVGDLYGRELTVELISKLRDEQMFNRVEELIAQIQKDVIAARQVLNGYSTDN